MPNANQLEIELLRTKARVSDLESVVKHQSDALKESTKLLLKSRPTRPPIPHDRKLLVAAEQGWRCADPYGDCIMHQIGDGHFTSAGGLFECDHKESWHTTFRTAGNIWALCAACHNSKTRRERLHALEQEQQEQEQLAQRDQKQADARHQDCSTDG